MGRIVGKATIVSAGPTPDVIGEMTAFTMDEQGADIAVNILGQTHGQGEVGQIDTTGEMTCNFNGVSGATDPAADPGQLLLVPGTKVAVVFQPNGAGTGKPEFTGTVNVIGRTLEVASANEIITATFGYRADGQMAEGVQT